MSVGLSLSVCLSDSADADTILQCLTDAEKKEFESLLDDPRQQAAILTLWTPWWESEEVCTIYYFTDVHVVLPCACVDYVHNLENVIIHV